MLGFEKLENNIIDLIKEEQAKLGYRKEKIHLYYPLSSLNHFFESENSTDEMIARLQQFPDYVMDRLGKVEVSNSGQRFCFCICADGVEYVHKNMKDNEFIKQLVDLVSDNACTLDSIIQFFQHTSNDICIEKMKGEEFDILIYFKENPRDKYYYCFKDEGMHIIYHRFLPQDYRDVMEN